MTLHQRIHEALESNPNGWCSPSKAGDLASLVVAMGGGTVVEIGLWGGRSFIPMALAVAYCGKGRAVGIDSFEGAAAAEGEDEIHAEWWKRVPFERIEEIFLENLAESGAQEFCEIIKRRSDDVEPPHDITVLHVDGQHQERAISDVSRFAPNVVLGGYAVLDDVNWEGGNVQKSMQILLDLGFVERRRVLGKEPHTVFENDYAILQRITYCK